MSNLLEVNNISKRIKGKEILKGISFNLEQGKVLGIMGPNGQGKTTLLNVIQGFLKADNGEIKINGNPQSALTKNDISFLQDVNIFNKSMRIKDAINLYVDFFDDFDKEKVNYYLE
ncbi:MAG: ATP-binding cassette domain-containing protein, partial [Clostridium sp.]